MKFYVKIIIKLLLLFFITLLIGWPSDAVCASEKKEYKQEIDIKSIEIEVNNAIITKEEQTYISGGQIRDGKLTWQTEKRAPQKGQYFGIIEYTLKNNSQDNYNIQYKDMQLVVDGDRKKIVGQIGIESGPAFGSGFGYNLDKGDSKTEKLLFAVPRKDVSNATLQYLGLPPINIEFKYKKASKKSSSIGKFEKADLFGAVKEGDQEKAEKIIGSGIDVNCKDEAKNTPLILACFFNQRNIVEVLISNGADVNMRNNNGTPALGAAAVKGNEEITKLLLNRGVSSNQRINDNGGTALMLAAIHGHKELASLLLEKGANASAKNNDGTPALTFAAINGRLAIMELLIEKGADANAHDIHGSTPLMFAAIRGNSKAANLLITKGADVNVAMKTGDTALMMASKNGHKTVVELLLDNGANVNFKNKKGRSALDFAKETGNQQIATLLQQKLY
jgi:ankyrin repeat protein